MKLIDALRIANQPSNGGEKSLRAFLACGFMPLHLETFLKAELRTCNGQRDVEILTGVFGDLSGNLHRLRQATLDVGIVVLEWSDIDPRLGFRALGGWNSQDLPSLVQDVQERIRFVTHELIQVASTIPLVVCLPTLAIAPVFSASGFEATAMQFELTHRLHELATSLAAMRKVRIVNPQRLDQLSPPSERRDAKAEIHSGFPYRLEHASCLAQLIAHLALPALPKKGLITDLDNTLWRGVVGDVGPLAITWDLAHRSQVHGLYQQLLSALSSAGTLLGVASKNDPKVVQEAFRRDDFLLSPDDLFPVEVGWGRKSESVSRILQKWNLGSDSVVFVDDSPLELEEVRTVHPDIKCVRFPQDDPHAVLQLLEELRDDFGKSTISTEDELRARSIRQSEVVRQSLESRSSSAVDAEKFMAEMQGKIRASFSKTFVDDRAFELVNKTNQFNLNGRRYTQSDWERFLRDDETLSVVVDYRDKFGPLGKIAVLAGRKRQNAIRLETWVLSCRAFSRRIEHQCLRLLFDECGVDEIELAFQPTPKNGPVYEFLQQVTEPSGTEWRISRDTFLARCPRLYHEVERCDGAESDVDLELEGREIPA